MWLATHALKFRGDLFCRTRYMKRDCPPAILHRTSTWLCSYKTSQHYTNFSLISGNIKLCTKGLHILLILWPTFRTSQVDAPMMNLPKMSTIPSSLCVQMNIRPDFGLWIFTPNTSSNFAAVTHNNTRALTYQRCSANEQSLVSTPRHTCRCLMTSCSHTIAMCPRSGVTCKSTRPAAMVSTEANMDTRVNGQTVDVWSLIRKHKNMSAQITTDDRYPRQIISCRWKDATRMWRAST